MAAFGGRAGVRDLGLLEGAVAAPLAGFGEEELYKNIFKKLRYMLIRLLKLSHLLTATRELV